MREENRHQPHPDTEGGRIQRKEVIASKKQKDFYKQCYAGFGYEVEAEHKNPFHGDYTVILRHTGNMLNEAEEEELRRMEGKLRIVEIIAQKKRRFFGLFFHLLFQVCLFCIQSLLFSGMHFQNAHPGIMIRAGVVILQAVLFFGAVMKIYEWVRWDAAQKSIQRDILNPAPAAKLAKKDKEFYISVLFTRGTGFTSNLLYWITGRQYTHASIGLGTQTDSFYSFTFKGFRTEHPSHRRLPGGRKDSLCCQFVVTEEEYRKLEQVIEQCLREKEELHYNTVGTVFCVLRIYLPVKQKKVYFCSEFVSEQLRNMKSFHLKQAANMYFPNNLAKALCQQENLYRVIVNEV